MADLGKVVAFDGEVVGRIVGTAVTPDGRAVEVEMEVDDEWAARVGLKTRPVIEDV